MQFLFKAFSIVWGAAQSSGFNPAGQDEEEPARLLAEDGLPLLTESDQEIFVDA